jgi:hypothetical protein
MDLLNEFRRHAGECRNMAKQARTSSDREIWQAMAERWVQCAEMMESETVAAHNNASAIMHQHRKRPQPWLHPA